MKVLEKPNTRIPGSAYYRGFCLRCRTPMRVATSDWSGLCEMCDPPTPGNRFATLTPRQRVGIDDEGLKIISLQEAIEKDID